MDGYNFEKVVAQIYLDNGYTDVEVTRGSGDNGVDVIAYKDGVKHGIQCKYYNGKVGNKAVQEVLAGSLYWGCHKAVVVTNSEYTEPAKDLALTVGVQLINGNMLKKLDTRNRLTYGNNDEKEDDYDVYSEVLVNAINRNTEKLQDIVNKGNTTSHTGDLRKVVKEDIISKFVIDEEEEKEQSKHNESSEDKEKNKEDKKATESITGFGCLTLLLKIVFFPLYLTYVYGKVIGNPESMSQLILISIVVLLIFMFLLLNLLFEIGSISLTMMILFLISTSLGYIRGRSLKTKL